MAATTYDAISDPTRRRVLGLLAEGERTAGEIATVFTISRPAISRHLRVLREAGLVHVRPRAQQRVYALDPRPLDDVDAWLRSITAFWEPRLDALGRHLDERSGR